MTQTLKNDIYAAITQVMVMLLPASLTAILIAIAAGVGYGAKDEAVIGYPQMIYFIRISFIFMGITTLLQSLSWRGFGANLPLIQGSTLFMAPLIAPLMVGYDLGAFMTAALCSSIFSVVLGYVFARISVPPLVLALVLFVGAVSLLRFALYYAAGGGLALREGFFGAPEMWVPAVIVALTALFFRFVRPKPVAMFYALVFGSIAAWLLDNVSLGAVFRAAFITVPRFMPWEMSFSLSLTLGMCAVAFINALMTAGYCTILSNAPQRQQVKGALWAEGAVGALGTFFGAMPSTSTGQNVALERFSPRTSRRAPLFAGGILILCGMVPKLSVFLLNIPENVIGGALILLGSTLFISAIKLLKHIHWNIKTALNAAICLGVAFGLPYIPIAAAQPITALALLPAVLLCWILAMI